MAATACIGSMEPIEIHRNDTEYDAYQAAMFDNGEDLITKVKRAARIENFFTQVYKSSPDSRWFVTLCPFHNDTHPSMWIDTHRQLCGCNTCGFKPLDVINLYARQHNLSESVAVGALAKAVGVWG